MRTVTVRLAVLVGVAVCLGACGGGSADLTPELEAHLGEYEQLIKQYEPKFDAVRHDPPAFAKVAEDYKHDTETWMNGWETLASDLSEDEGKAVKAGIDKLNRRAVKMLTGA